MADKYLENLTKEQLIELIDAHSRNCLALSGLWFQAVERHKGMEEAMIYEKEAWEQYTVVEAQRIKKFLNLPEHPGLEGLAEALRLRFYSNLNESEIILNGNTLLYRMLDCRVQNARKRKGMEFHACKPTGEVEYEGFARTIDSRISCRCISCFPDITDPDCNCSWEFSLNE